jgi:putative transposase
LDEELKSSFGLNPLHTPVRAPKANAYCERLIGTMRRECLDFLIPLSEKHLRKLLLEWVSHFNPGRPHSSLGPGIPDGSNPSLQLPVVGRHVASSCSRVGVRPVLGGLHHEYRWEKTA